MPENRTLRSGFGGNLDLRIIRGLMVGVELTVPVKEVREPLLFEERIFTGYSGLYTLRILPPLILSTKEVDIFVGSLKKVLDEYYENSR